MENKKIIVKKETSKENIKITKATLSKLNDIGNAVDDIRENISEQEPTSPRTVNRQQKRRVAQKRIQNQEQQNKNILKILEIARKELISRKLNKEKETNEEENLDLKTVEEVVHELLSEFLLSINEITLEEISELVKNKFDQYDNIINSKNIGTIDALEKVLQDTYNKVDQIAKKDNKVTVVNEDNKAKAKNDSRNSMNTVYRDIPKSNNIDKTNISPIDTSYDRLTKKYALNDVPFDNKKGELNKTNKEDTIADKENNFETTMAEETIIKNTIFGKAVGWLWKRIDKTLSKIDGKIKRSNPDDNDEETKSPWYEKLLKWAGGIALFNKAKSALGFGGVVKGAAGAGLGSLFSAQGLGALGWLGLGKLAVGGVGIGYLGHHGSNALANMYKGSGGLESGTTKTIRNVGGTVTGAVGGAMTTMAIIGTAAKLGAKMGAWAGPKGIAVGAVIGGLIGLGTALFKTNKIVDEENKKYKEKLDKAIEEETKKRIEAANKLGQTFDEVEIRKEVTERETFKHDIDVERRKYRGKSDTALKAIADVRFGSNTEELRKAIKYIELTEMSPRERRAMTAGYVDPLEHTKAPELVKTFGVKAIEEAKKEYLKSSPTKILEAVDEKEKKVSDAIKGISYQDEGILGNYKRFAIEMTAGRTDNFKEVLEGYKKGRSFISDDYRQGFSDDRLDKLMKNLEDGYNKTINNLSNKNVEIGVKEADKTNQLTQTSKATDINSSAPVNINKPIENKVSVNLNNEELINFNKEQAEKEEKRHKELIDVIDKKEDDPVKTSFMGALLDLKKGIHGLGWGSSGSGSNNVGGRSRDETGDYTSGYKTNQQTQQATKTPEELAYDIKTKSASNYEGVDKNPYPVTQRALEANTNRNFNNFNPDNEIVKGVAALRTGAEAIRHTNKYNTSLVTSSTIPLYNKDKSRDVEKQYLSEYIAPVILGKKSLVTSNFGYRPENKGVGSTYHMGIDFRAKAGDPVYAYEEGKVIKSGLRGGFGNVVAIQHADGTVTQSAHLSKLGVKVGDIVTKGQYLGNSGGTGKGGKNQYAPHLDFTVYKDSKMNVAIDPIDYDLRRQNEQYKKIVEGREQSKSANEINKTEAKTQPPTYLLKEQPNKQETTITPNNTLQNSVYNQSINNNNNLVTNNLEQKANPISKQELGNNNVTNKQVPSVFNNNLTTKESVNNTVVNNDNTKTETISNNIQSNVNPTNVNNNKVTEQMNTSTIVPATNTSETMAKKPQLSQIEVAQIETSRNIQKVAEKIAPEAPQNTMTVQQPQETNHQAYPAVPNSVVDPAPLIPLLIQYMFGIRTDGSNSNQLLPGMI